MPNALAYLAVFAWPVVGAFLFSRLPHRQAIIWTILGGYLLLPEKTAVDLPLLPAFDKIFIPAATALLFCLPRLRSPLELLPRAALPRALAVVFLLSPFVTVATNGAPVAMGPVLLRGLELYDAFAFGLSHAVLLVPFLLGQRFLASEEAMRDLLTAFALAGLAYSLPALFEVRMSPQLHNWIYGFFPHQFGQQIRFDGFRPVVFLSHGLVAALFFSMALLAACALWRGHHGDRRRRWGLAAAWLVVVLALCKTVSAWTYAALLLPAMLLVGRLPQRLVLLAVASTVLLYPALRGTDLVPVERIEAVAGSISEDRAGSLRHRLNNEDMLLDRAARQPLFGWGGWGRSRVYDPISGEDVSTTDGQWVITIGQYGWVGYGAEFGLLVWPLLVLGALGARRRASFAAIALALVLCANLIDLIPNSGMTPLTWLLAGALTGAVAARRPAQEATRARRPAAATPPPRPVATPRRGIPGRAGGRRDPSRSG